jgi:hypothetical protein
VFGGKRALVVAADTPCAELVPTPWRDGVAHAPDPAPAPAGPVAPAATAPESAKTDYWRAMYEWALGETKKWTGFGVAEAQRVEDANGRTRDAISIISTCEKRDADAVKHAAK